MPAPPVTDPLIAPALPGLGPSRRGPFARAIEPDEALREVFGFPGFRPGQREAVEAAIAGRDVLVVMPTGSGKSLCYQLPALMRADLTLVVSPLVSLMQDQVEALERAAPGTVALVNAQQDAAANRAAVDRAVSGRARLLYVAPERFSSPGFLERIRQARIGLFVVDEAHCVSQWGHDFRPDYFRLADAARWLGAQAIVASTATATPQVAQRHRGAPRAARSGPGRDRLRPPEPLVRRRPVRDQGGRPPRHRGGARGAGRAARDRLRGHARGVRQARRRGWRTSSARRWWPTTRACRARRAPTRSGASWTVRSTSSWRPTRSGWASTRPTCGRSATRRCRLDRGLLPGGRPRRPRRRARPAACCSRPRATRACTCSSSSARRSRSRR